MVSKVARLQFHTEVYTGKNKYEGRYSFKERSSEHQGRQQRYSTLEGQIMATKDNSRGYNNERRQNKCQQNKVQHQKKAGELHPLEIPQGLWQEISIDIIGLLPKSNGMDAIVIIVD